MKWIMSVVAVFFVFMVIGGCISIGIQLSNIYFWISVAYALGFMGFAVASWIYDV